MKNRIIMFEGCDRTGKSTFIDLLKQELIDHDMIPIVFHLMGPTKFKEFNFSNDEKSLIQLSKFDDEYNLFREILNANEKNVIILDRSSFGEYIWTRYWNRSGKYTDYVTSSNFINRHNDLMKQTLYIDYFMSNIEELENRILASFDDKKIFTLNDKSIKENIKYVYSLYEELDEIVKNEKIHFLKIDSSVFPSVDHVKDYVKSNFNFILNYD